jgi:NAD(P)H-dependent flavin oxidoreductase YrpB (nitropropane dioxygenase family)
VPYAASQIPACVDICKKYKSPLTGQPVQVVAAGGIVDGRGLAASLAFGATAVWVGTRFVCAKEAGASPVHQQAVVDAGFDDSRFFALPLRGLTRLTAARTIIFTGRPLRCLSTPFIEDWEQNKQAKIKELTGKGILPVGMEDPEVRRPTRRQRRLKSKQHRPVLMGKAAALIKDVQPAAAIIDEMMQTAYKILKSNAGAKL